jgi:hypothetical protein
MKKGNPFTFETVFPKNGVLGKFLIAILVILSVEFSACGTFTKASDPVQSGPVQSGGVVPSAPVQREPINAYFFYEELCSLCQTDEDRFMEILREKLPPAERDRYPNNFYRFNAHNTLGRQNYVYITDKMGLDRSTLQFPLLILGGRVFQGYDSIGANIREAYLTAAGRIFP